MSGRGTERERETERQRETQNWKEAPGSELSQLNCEIMT